jgi:RNA polymerase sigma-70 factor (ECF subfamily)
VDRDADDESLLREALRAGDPEAYESLVRRHGDWMLGLARRLLGNDGDAEDAFQDACLGAFRGIGAFQGEARLSTWLHRIVVNAALMRLRSRRRTRSRSGPGAASRERPAALARHVDPVLASAQRDEVSRIVRRAVDRLPPLHRAVFVLCDVESFPFARVAEAIGLSVSGTKSRLHRARRALRSVLAPYAPEERPRVRDLQRRRQDGPETPEASETSEPPQPRSSSPRPDVPPWPPAWVESPEPEATPPPEAR